MSSETKPIRISFDGFAFVVAILLLGLTGNCECCGLDRDYLGDYLDKGGE